MVNEYQKAYRAANKQRIAERRLQKYEEDRIELLELVGGGKCKDCGIADHRVLQFDHLRDKIGPVMNQRLKADKIAEALKCEVVCANCHFIRSKERLRAKVNTFESD